MKRRAVLIHREESEGVDTGRRRQEATREQRTKWPSDRLTQFFFQEAPRRSLRAKHFILLYFLLRLYCNCFVQREEGGWRSWTTGQTSRVLFIVLFSVARQEPKEQKNSSSEGNNIKQWTMFLICCQVIWPCVAVSTTEEAHRTV